jgi:DNA polymerase III epsilon subunit-like protein
LWGSHNAHFDKSVFERELKNAQISIPNWQWKNTIPIFGRVFAEDNIKSKSLDYLCEKYLKKPSTSHRAKGDLENLQILMRLAAEKIDSSKTTSYIWDYFCSL